MLVRTDMTAAEELEWLAGRPDAGALVLTLPLPTSDNRRVTVRGGRIVPTARYARTKRGLAWHVRAACAGRPPLERFELRALFPPSRVDVSNYLKQLLDALQQGGAVADDKGLRFLAVAVHDARGDRSTCLIELRAAGARPNEMRPLPGQGTGAETRTRNSTDG